MGMHSYNFGLKTSGKGEIFESFSVAIGAAGAPGAIAQAAANLIASVTGGSGAGATGTYTVQMNAPYPPKIISVDCSLSAVAADGSLITPRYQDGSYNNLTGQFVILTSSTAPAAADPTSGTTLMVQLTFEQYTTIPA